MKQKEVCNFHNLELRNSKGNKGKYCPNCYTEKYWQPSWKADKDIKGNKK